MKKRILSGLLLTATVAVGFSTFTSCKDTDEDLRTEFTSQQMSLETALEKLKGDVKDIKSCDCKVLDADSLVKLLQQAGPIAEVDKLIQAQIDALNLFGEDGKSGVLDGIENDIDGLETILKNAGLNNMTPAEAAAFAAFVPKAQEIVDFVTNYKPVTPGKDYDDTKIKADIAKLQTSVNNLTDLINGNDEKNIVGLLKQVADNKAAIDTNTGDISKIKGDITDITSDVSGLKLWFTGLTNEDGTEMSVDQFQEYVKQGEWVKANKASMESVYDYIYGNADKGIEGKKEVIDALNKEAIDSLNANFKEFEKLKNMYSTLFPDGIAADKEWWSYETVMTNIQNNQTAIEELQKEVKENRERIERLENNLDNMVTSLLLQTTVNPLFGSINTPFGVNSMVLMAYYGKLSTGLESFPASNQSTEYCIPNVDPEINKINWSSMMSGDASDVAYNPVDFNGTGNLIATNKDNLATLGTLWFTVNPTTVANLNGTFSLVNSIDKEVPVKFEAVKDNETVFKFGYTSRAAEDNGLYRAEALIDPAELDNIKINIEPGLKDALVNAVKNHTVTDIAHMLKEVYGQLQNVCDANALCYAWDSYDALEDGTWSLKKNKVYSNYGLAATAFKPLSFHTLYGSSFRKIPHIGSIELSKDLVDLGFKPFKIGNVTLNIDLKIESIEIGQVGETIITVKIPQKYDVNVDGTGSGEATLPANWDTTPGMYSEITVDITKDLQGVVNSIQTSIDEWIKGVPGNENKPGLNAQINNAIKNAVDDAFNGKDGLVTSIEGQVNDMMGDIQDKVDDLVNKINKDYLGKVNNLIGKVNKVSDRINNVLSDPNHYLQAMMMYKDANGNLRLLSTDPKRPSQFKGNGEAIELFATTYNFETICPVFKKFVGVNKVTTANGSANVTTLKKNANNGELMGKVIEGDKQRVALDVKGATNGVYTYEIAYQALDFHGYTSTVKCYVQVIR